MVSLLDKRDFDDLQIRIEGVSDLDFTIDDAKLTMPEPETILGLLAIGGLGLGMKRKEQK